jgi:hypothetical protein
MPNIPDILNFNSLGPLPLSGEAIVNWIRDDADPVNMLGWLPWCSPTAPGCIQLGGNMGGNGLAQYVLGLWGYNTATGPITDRQVLMFDTSLAVPDSSVIGNLTWSNVIGGVNIRTTASETIDELSIGQLITFGNAAATACALDSSTCIPYFLCFVQVVGAGTVTFTPSAGQINDGTGLAASASLATGQSATLFFNGTNWSMLKGAGSGGGSAGGGVNNQTGTSYTVVSGDNGKLLTISNAAPFALTLPNAPTLTPAATFYTDVENRGAGLVTLTPTTSTIDGLASITLPTDRGLRVFSDGTNYFTQRGRFLSPLVAKGDIYVRSASADSRLAVGLDGQMVVADSSQAVGLAYSDLPERTTVMIPGFYAPGQPAVAFKAAFAVTYGANFAGSVGGILAVAGGANPTATQTFNVYKNTTLIGTIVISTSGVFTFATVGGVPVTFNVNDILTVVCPGASDATLAGFTFTLYGTKGLVAQNSIISPVITFGGVYSGATTYSTYQVVGYRGGLYLSLQPTTGNAPTVNGNNAFWNFLMGNGWSNAGIYNPATSYVENQTVRYIATGTSYGTYLCISPTTGGAGHVPTNAIYWVPVAEAGVDGSTTSAQVQQQAFVYCGTAGGTGNAITLSPSPALGSLADGTGLEFRASANNTAAVTVNASSLGVVALVNPDGSALTTGNLKSNGIYRIVYNNALSKWQIESGGGGVPIISKLITNVTDPMITNPTLWPGMFTHPDIPPTSPNAKNDEHDDAVWNTNGLWTWVNQGTTTAAQSKSWLQMYCPAQAGDVFRMIVQSAPATPYTVTAKMTVTGPQVTNNFAGLGFRDSATGRMVGWVRGNSGSGAIIGVVHPASAWIQTEGLYWIGQIYMRIVDDGTNHKFYYGWDGVNYTLFRTQSRTTWAANPNQFGFGTESLGGQDIIVGADYIRVT